MAAMWGLERHGSAAWGEGSRAVDFRAASCQSLGAQETNSAPSARTLGASIRSSWSSHLQGSLHFNTFHESGPRATLLRVLSSPWFDYFVSAVCVLNSIVIGLEQSCRLEGAECQAFEHAETSLVLFYFLELCAVLYAGGLSALYSGWVRFDAAMVLVGVLSQALLLSRGGLQLGKYLQLLKLLRIARTLRLARTLRAVLRFREFCMLAQGFMNSLNTLLHTLLLGFALLYICSCTAMELIPLSMQGEDLSEELRASIDSHFRSLPVTMLSLLQFFSFDSSHVIYRPWLEAQPATAFFFVAALLLMGVVFMNLVTAVIINSALEEAMQDHEMQRAMAKSKRKALLQRLRAAFEEADENRSGELSAQELLLVYKREARLMHGVLGHRNDFLKLFNYLDVDGNGSIGIGELCNGIEELVLSEAPLELKRIERMVESMREQVKELLKPSEAAAASSPWPSPQPSATASFQATSFQQEAAAPPSASFKASSFEQAPAAMPAWACEIVEGLKELALRLEEATHPTALERVASLAAAAAVKEAFCEEEEEEERSEAQGQGGAAWAAPEAAPRPVPKAPGPLLYLNGRPCDCSTAATAAAHSRPLQPQSAAGE